MVPLVVRFVVPPVSSSGSSTKSSSDVSVVAVIPARYHSTRLPGKALADICGRPMIEHVYRRASAAKSIQSVIVATDDERILRAVLAFGGRARMTSRDHQSGTDRLAEIAADLSCDLVVNVQGDEPLIDPEVLDEAIAPFVSEPSLMMSTLRRRIDDPADLVNPNVTKVVTDADGYALYFSRSAIPFRREGCPPAPAWRHIGLYVYRRECLLRLAALEPTPMERSEALEQLRAVEHGIRIRVVETCHDSIGVDTPDDLERARQEMSALSAQRGETLVSVSAERHHAAGAPTARHAGAERGHGDPASDGDGGSGGAKPPGKKVERVPENTGVG
jgi:3-deoxy-manno-octulosonate cytidylyltransferase (CMP-KDO synthetase)